MAGKTLFTLLKVFVGIAFIGVFFQVATGFIGSLFAIVAAVLMLGILLAWFAG